MLWLYSQVVPVVGSHGASLLGSSEGPSPPLGPLLKIIIN